MVESRGLTEGMVWDALKDVHDPEIPTLSIVELKIVRSVSVQGARIAVEITPTFSGCPALDLMKDQIIEKVVSLGAKDVAVNINRSLVWSTDLLDHETKLKLREHGIAPPPVLGKNLAVTLQLPVECPYCGSSETTLESSFGPTLCRQIFYCDKCRQSFERFKPL
jgi:ring-1,2-phenylacetyl-CoA epoxidase subunit PaaD